MIFHCDFDLHFLMISNVRQIISVGHLYVFSGRMSIQISAHFFNHIVFVQFSCISSISPLSDKRFANIFSDPVGCFLLLLKVSFALQEHFSLVPHIYFCFCCLCFLVSNSKIVTITHVHELIIDVFF